MLKKIKNQIKLDKKKISQKKKEKKKERGGMWE